MTKFVEGLADRLKVPEGARDVQVFDDELPGFGIRKFDSGNASYFVKYSVGQQQRRKALGKVVRGNLKPMRLEASAILAKARLGTDVVAEAEAKAAATKNIVTLGALVPKYLQVREVGSEGWEVLRPKSLTETARYLEKTWKPLHRHAIDAITRDDIMTVVDAIERDSGKASADRAKAALSGLYAWAIDRGRSIGLPRLDANPTINVRSRVTGGGRTRVLSEPELREIWLACEDAGEFGAIVRLLILTGQR